MPYDDDYFVCPHCGEDVPADASYCPACGSDDETGWSDDAAYAGLDLPDDEEDAYEAESAAAEPTAWQRLIVATAALLIVLLAAGLVYMCY